MKSIWNLTSNKSEFKFDVNDVQKKIKKHQDVVNQSKKQFDAFRFNMSSIDITNSTFSNNAKNFSSRLENLGKALENAFDRIVHVVNTVNVTDNELSEMNNKKGEAISQIKTSLDLLEVLTGISTIEGIFKSNYSVFN